jgi:hypothetical protein
VTPDEYVDTWKGIAAFIGRSDRWCRYMAHREDPLPVFKLGGMVRMSKMSYEEWLARQQQAGIKEQAL